MYTYQQWPDLHRHLLLAIIVGILLCGVLGTTTVYPKWKELQESRYAFDRTERKLKQSEWPRDSARLQKTLQTYQKLLDDRNSGLKVFAENVLKDSTSTFTARIVDEYGSHQNFVNKASQIEYRDQHDRLDSAFQAKGIFLLQRIYGLDETSVESNKYQMLLKLWTTEAIVNQVLQHKLSIASDRNDRTGARTPQPAAKITALPVKSYILDPQDKAPYLFEFPVRLTVRGSLSNFCQMLADLQKEGTFLPVVNLEISATVPGKFAAADAEGKLTSRSVEVTFVCSSFYRITADTPRQNTTTTTLPTLPRGM